MYDWLIVGAGFAGSVLAERLASERNERVLLIDRRNHVGGNAYDRYDENGLLIHQYGPHIFHTNSKAIFDHLSKFTEWRSYEHRVLAAVDDKLVPIPINLDTVNTLYGLDLSSEELVKWFAARAEPVDNVKTSEDVVVSAVGRELYEKFFRGYTRKQWGLDPSELDKSVTARVPTRTNRDDRYFGDEYQFMPKHGYTRMFETMLESPEYRRDDANRIRRHSRHHSAPSSHLHGSDRRVFWLSVREAAYRSLRFKHVTLDQPQFQSVAVVNYPQTEEFTRITEYKYLTGQEHPKTALTYEYPSAEGDPDHPIPKPENQELFKKYERLALTTPNVWFVGRLATYRYYNMDQIVGQALATFRRINESLPISGDGPTVTSIAPAALAS